MVDEVTLQRAVVLFEVHGLGFADAHVVASAERTGQRDVSSLDWAAGRVEIEVCLDPD